MSLERPRWFYAVSPFVLAALLAGAAPAMAQPASALPSPVASATPAAVPVASPTPLPLALPTPTARPLSSMRELLIQGGLTVGKIYNDFAPGVTGQGAPSSVGAIAARFGAYALKIDERTDFFPTIAGPNGLTQFSTIDGGSAFVPPFTGKLTNVDVRAERSVFTKNLYVGISVDRETTSYGYPVLSGTGIGVEEYPSFKPFDLVGSLFYYPSMTGSYTVSQAASHNFGKSYALSFGALKYDFGTDFALSKALYAYIGYNGYRILKQGTNQSVQNAEGPYVGIGARLFKAGDALDEPAKTTIHQQVVDPYNGFVEFAPSFGGANAVGVVTGGGNTGSYQFSGAYRSGRYAIVGDFHQVQFDSQLDPFVPGQAITQRETLGEIRGEVSIAPHDSYFGIGILNKGSNNGFPGRPGIGLGFEKLPNLLSKVSPFASVFYYAVPSTYTALNPNDFAFGQTLNTERRYLVFDYGVTFRPTKRAYVFAGLWGYHGNAGSLPIDETHSAPYVGLGTRI